MASELRRNADLNSAARIAVLPPEVANRIAAGEVIERPASVVKELVENAIDAGARQIEVLLEGGGIDRIQVHDDGRGIPPEQLADAFERHATSKLRSAEDLFAIGTLGFRGEALAAVAAAADVDLVTRPAGQAAAGSVRLRGGQLVRQGSAAAGEGTRIDVRELFATLPARRRFLRSARSEATACVRVVAELALAYPTIAFRVRSDGRVTLDAAGAAHAMEADGVDALRAAMAAVHGRAFADPLLALPSYSWGDEAGEARVAVEGLISPPQLHRANRRYLHLIANGRAIRARGLIFAVERAFEGRLPGGRHPGGVLRIVVPPDQIDVNVHPTKAEVRFRHERAVFSALTRAVGAALDAATTPDAPIPAALPSVALTQGGTSLTVVATTFDQGDARDRPEATRRRVLTEAGAPSAVALDPAAAAAGAELPLRQRLPVLRPLGQFDATYLVAESADGLVLIDQHAAHERVLYERLRAARDRVVVTQPLLDTVVVDLGGTLAALASEQAEALADLGWEIAEADGGVVLLRAVPAALRRQDPARALREYLDQLLAEERLSGPDRAVATLACRAAVMAGDRMDDAQQRALLRDLENCEAPHTCPHGRPTTLHLSSDQLERSFGRR